MSQESTPRFPPGRLAKWILVGVLFMGFNLPMLYVLVDLLHLRLPLATLTAALIGTLLRFLVNDRFVFGHATPTWARLRAYYAANLLAFILWYTVANSLPHLGVHYLLAAVLATGCSVGCSAATNFLWVWRHKPPPRP
jgi:putative flippase GtrA